MSEQTGTPTRESLFAVGPGDRRVPVRWARGRHPDLPLPPEEEYDDTHDGEHLVCVVGPVPLTVAIVCVAGPQQRRPGDTFGVTLRLRSAGYKTVTVERP